MPALFGNEGTSWAVSGRTKRPERKWGIFEESIRVDEEIEGLAAFYRVIKELLGSYRKVLDTTHSLADWPSRKLVEEFIQDEERHQAEINLTLAQWNIRTGFSVCNWPWISKAAGSVPAKENCRTISIGDGTVCRIAIRTPVIEANFQHVQRFWIRSGVPVCRDWLEDRKPMPVSSADGLCVADDGARRG